MCVYVGSYTGAIFINVYGSISLRYAWIHFGREISLPLHGSTRNSAHSGAGLIIFPVSAALFSFYVLYFRPAGFYQSII